MSADPATRAVAIAALRAAPDAWEPERPNGVSIAFDGKSIRWLTWAPNRQPISGKIEVQHDG